MVQWCLFNLHHILSFLCPTPSITPILLLLLPPPPPFFLSYSLFLDLEDEQAQVDVFGGQQFVALHRIRDGQRDIIGLISVIAEGVVMDDWLDPHVVVRPLQQQKGALQGRVHLYKHKHNVLAKTSAEYCTRSMLDVSI